MLYKLFEINLASQMSVSLSRIDSAINNLGIICWIDMQMIFGKTLLSLTKNVLIFITKYYYIKLFLCPTL